MNDDHIDYKTHILIGVRANGVMTVIHHWAYVPRQAEVQEEINGSRDNYTTFVLCTPTSVMPVLGGAGRSSGRYTPTRGSH